MNRFSQLLTGLFVALVALTGCNGNSSVTIKLTDASGDFKAAVVTIDQVYFQGEGGRVVLRDTPVTTNLLTLANDTADLVDGASVPEGRYSDLRFVISGAYVEVENADGSTSLYASSEDYAGLPEGAQVAGPLQMPSFGSSGLKVKLPEGGVEVRGEQKVLLVDFDVAASFGHEAGDRWVMHPRLEATDIAFSGSAKVEVKLGEGVTLPGGQTLARYSVALVNAEGSRELLALTDANADGTFEAEFKWLIPGTFELSVAAPEGFQVATSPAKATITVGSGQVAPTTVFTVTAASAK